MCILFLAWKISKQGSGDVFRSSAIVKWHISAYTKQQRHTDEVEEEEEQGAKKHTQSEEKRIHENKRKGSHTHTHSFSFDLMLCVFVLFIYSSLHLFG